MITSLLVSFKLNLILKGNEFTNITVINIPQPLPENFRLVNSFFQQMTFTSLMICNHYNFLINLKVESCSFLNCSSSVNAGVIFFATTLPGNVDLKMICVTNCYHTPVNSYYQFARINTRAGWGINAGNITFNYVSISKCIPSHITVGTRVGSFYLEYGNQTIRSTNFSLNSCYHYSAGYYTHANKFDMNFTTISNNINANEQLICFNSGSNTFYEVTSINFVNNTYITWGWSSQISGQMVIKNSIFSGNIGSGSLFLIYSSTTQLLYCVVMHPGSIHTSPYFLATGFVNILTANRITETYAIDHFKSAECHADISGPTPTMTVDCPLPTPAQTLYPSPSECLYSNIGQELLITSINYLLPYWLFWNILY